jgi:hypothetical protein
MAQINERGVKRHFSISRTRAAEKGAVFNARARLVFAPQDRSHAATLLDVATPPASLNRDKKKYLKPENLEMTKINLARSRIHPWHSHYSPAPRHRDLSRSPIRFQYVPDLCAPILGLPPLARFHHLNLAQCLKLAHSGLLG